MALLPLHAEFPRRRGFAGRERPRRVVRDRASLGSQVRTQLCPEAPTLQIRPDDRGHLDEMFVKIRGKRMYLWRVVDAEGEVLDFLIQSKRNKAAAFKLMRKLLKKQGVSPTAIVTDKLPSYGAALRVLGLSHRHEMGGRKNNRAENSHQPVRRRERKMQQDAAFPITRLCPTISLRPCRHTQHVQHPNTRRHLISANEHREHRKEAIRRWRRCRGCCLSSDHAAPQCAQFQDS